MTSAFTGTILEETQSKYQRALRGARLRAALGLVLLPVYMVTALMVGSQIVFAAAPGVCALVSALALREFIRIRSLPAAVPRTLPVGAQAWLMTDELMPVTGTKDQFVTQSGAVVQISQEQMAPGTVAFGARILDEETQRVERAIHLARNGAPERALEMAPEQVTALQIR
jgi:hypothetical protein